MIRVRLFSEETMPPSLLARLGATGELTVLRDRAPADVLLIYVFHWNREAFTKLNLGGETTLPAVVLCARTEQPYATDSVLRKQVYAVLPSDAEDRQIVSALGAAAARLRILPEFTDIRPPDETSPLTPRELEILRLIADGEGNKTIAHLLQISEHTVKFHISSIFHKLQVFNRTEAVKAGITRGLISI